MVSLYKEPLLFAVIIVTLIVGGCGNLENGRGWGQDALWPIDSDRIIRAAHNAFFDSETLIPLAGALVFAIDNFDEKTSDWAVKHTPIFGSEKNARDASDNLMNAIGVEAVVTALATRSGDNPVQWSYSKLKGLAVEVSAASATGGATALLKDATGRKRPDKGSDTSFPSGHTSAAFSFMTLANRNLDYTDLPTNLRSVVKIGNALAASGVAWARVEGRRHYPSDVLVGAALGHFLTAFIHDAFLNLPEQSEVQFTISPVEQGAVVGLAFCF